MSRRRTSQARKVGPSQPAGSGAFVKAPSTPQSPNNPKGDDRLNHAAGGAVAEGREHEAVANARHRLELQRQAVGERHPEYATGLNQLALLLIMHGDPDRAEPLLREALAIRKDVLGERHPDYATNLSSLA